MKATAGQLSGVCLLHEAVVIPATVRYTKVRPQITASCDNGDDQIVATRNRRGGVVMSVGTRLARGMAISSMAGFDYTVPEGQGGEYSLIMMWPSESENCEGGNNVPISGIASKYSSR